MAERLQLGNSKIDLSKNTSKVDLQSNSVWSKRNEEIICVSCCYKVQYMNQRNSELILILNVLNYLYKNNFVIYDKILDVFEESAYNKVKLLSVIYRMYIVRCLHLNCQVLVRTLELFRPQSFFILSEASVCTDTVMHFCYQR